MEIFGYIGSIALALCAIPQAILSYRQGHSKGISVNFLLLWTLGEVFTLIYVIPKFDVPLIINYTANLFFLLIIWRYKFFPRK